MLIHRYARDNNGHIAEDFCSFNDKRLAFLGWVVPSPPPGIQHKAVWSSPIVQDHDSSIDVNDSAIGSSKQENEHSGICRTYGVSSLALQKIEAERDESFLKLKEALRPKEGASPDHADFSVPTLNLPETFSVSSPCIHVHAWVHCQYIHIQFIVTIM